MTLIWDMLGHTLHKFSNASVRAYHNIKEMPSLRVPMPILRPPMVGEPSRNPALG